MIYPDFGEVRGLHIRMCYEGVLRVQHSVMSNSWAMSMSWAMSNSWTVGQ